MATFTDVLAIKVALDGVGAFQRDMNLMDASMQSTAATASTLSTIVGGAMVVGFALFSIAATRAAADVEAFRLASEAAFGSGGPKFANSLIDFANASGLGRDKVISIAFDLISKQTNLPRAAIASGQSGLSGTDAYEAFLRGFNAKFPGAVDSVSNTLYGRWQSLMDRLGTALEPTGRIILVLVGSLVTLSGWLVTAFSFVNKWTGGIAGLVVMAGLLVGGLTLLSGWIETVTGFTLKNAAALMVQKVAQAATVLWTGLVTMAQWAYNIALAVADALLLPVWLAVTLVAIALVGALVGLYFALKPLFDLVAGWVGGEIEALSGGNIKDQMKEALSGVEGQLGEMNARQNEQWGKFVGRLARRDVAALIGGNSGGLQWGAGIPRAIGS